MALLKGSYYLTAPLFAPDETGKIVFKGMRPRTLQAPDPILEHSIALKDRLDSVAQHYYAEPRAWRRYADANPDVLFAEDILYKSEPIEELGCERLGEIVLIPAKRNGA
jgi:hypothetical protein